jgi:hypothetical protein
MKEGCLFRARFCMLRAGLGTAPTSHSSCNLAPKTTWFSGLFMERAAKVNLDHMRPESNRFRALFVWASEDFDGCCLF